MNRTLTCILASTLLCFSVPGCFLYFGGETDCLYGGDEPDPTLDVAYRDPLPPLQLRDPETGECHYFSGGGNNRPCDPTCGPCDDEPAEPLAEAAPLAPLPTWGHCESHCTYLDEATCLDTSGCRGIYLPDTGFAACWAVDQTGPIQGGGCEDLDAWTCSMHDDCIAIHESLCPEPAAEEDEQGPIMGGCSPGSFLSCADEPGEDPGQCYGEVACDGLPPECPDDSVPGRIPGECWTGACIPVSDCEP